METIKPNKKINWDIAEKNFVEIMQKNPEVFNVEHISLYAQNSEWDILINWKNGDKWYVDVTTGVRKKFNRPKVEGNFYLAFTTDGITFEMFEIIHRNQIR